MFFLENDVVFPLTDARLLRPASGILSRFAVCTERLKRACARRAYAATVPFGWGKQNAAGYAAWRGDYEKIAATSVEEGGPTLPPLHIGQR